MDAGTLGVMIPIIALMIPIVAIWTKHQQKVAEMQMGIVTDHKGRPVNNPQANAELKAEVEELRDRVRVLERIVTDGGYNLASEIEQLRDARTETERASGVPLNIESKEKA